MRAKKNLRFRVVLTLFLCVIFFLSSVSGLAVYLGDTVELSGGATADSVYLFITGPNLPSNGVSPDDVSSAVATGVPSSFTKVNVNNNRWKYKWDTNAAGGTLDYGNYVLYAVNTPSGRNDLSGKEYSYTQITLVNPSVSTSLSPSGINDQNTENIVTEAADIKKNEPTQVVTTVPPEQADYQDITSIPKETNKAGLYSEIVILALFLSSVLIIRAQKDN